MLRFDSWKAIVLSSALLFVAAAGAPAQTFTTLYSFCSQTNCTDGQTPVAPLIQGLDGNLYSTTGGGGAYEEGTVFKITRSGILTTLYSFCKGGSTCADGDVPEAPLVLATNGDFYGTTYGGGSHAYSTTGGTVFRITAGGALTTLHSFCSETNCTDGSSPWAGLVQATNGDLYGTTEVGGSDTNNCPNPSPACGNIFKITPGGALTSLHSFCAQTGCPDGKDPFAGLIQATNGDLYGVTPFGGSTSGQYTCAYGDEGCGTIFKMTPGGTLSTLYTFCKDGTCTDGERPGWNLYSGGGAGLVQGADGNFYGTTFDGGGYCSLSGCGNGAGTIFKITPGGTLTTLYSFCAQPNCTDGAYPNAGLIQGTDGNFYGTTEAGGTSGALEGYTGTIFRITPGGELTTLYSFCSQANCTDGAAPAAGLVQATNGKFYGTTPEYGAGANCLYTFCGTVFSLDVGLGPFVETNPTSRKVGAKVTILGNNLMGSTSVTFNGTPANFTVKSGTWISATVPSGATTGYVKVTTAKGTTLTSNVKFRVP